jgi:hypothetical protein
MLIPVGDEALDLTAQVRDRGEGAAADRALRDQSEPALDLVQPGGISGCVMQVKTRMAREPRFDGGVFMRAVVIDDHVHVQILGHFGLDVTQESEELLVPMAWLALREHLAIDYIQGSKQGGCTVTVVVMRDAFEVAQSHGQHRLRALERLHLAFLIHTQYEGMIRGIQIQPDDVAHFLYEKRIRGELEGLRAMGLHTEQCQVALYGALAQAGGVGQCSDRPMCGSFWLEPQRGVEQLRDALLIVRARPTGLYLIVQPREAQLTKAKAPVMHCRGTQLEPPPHFRERHSRFVPQNQLRTAYQSVRHAA